MDHGYSLLADLIVIVHFLYVMFALGGQAIIMVGWVFRWQFIRQPVFRIIHLVTVAFVAMEAVIGMICPLTEWEYNLRHMAGQSIDRDLSFIARLIRMIIFYDFPPLGIHIHAYLLWHSGDFDLHLHSA